MKDEKHASEWTSWDSSFIMELRAEPRTQQWVNLPEKYLLTTY